jgi:hypothetical protein
MQGGTGLLRLYTRIISTTGFFENISSQVKRQQYYVSVQFISDEMFLVNIFLRQNGAGDSVVRCEVK